MCEPSHAQHLATAGDSRDRAYSQCANNLLILISSLSSNRKHFLDDPQVAASSGLRIGTPGDALAWVRARIG